jgi:ABC-type lipoprotein export system ATPase subunit
MLKDLVVDIQSVTKIYKTGKQEFKALNNVSLKIYKGDFLAFMGPSGSGKSTLMNLIGCLDRASSGEIYINGQGLSRLNDNRLAEIRSREIGFVFQDFNLIPSMTALRNVILPMTLAGIPRSSREQNAMSLLKKVGLDNWAKHLPTELSGGEKQRVAIARAIANSPLIILADEPTGNLDTKTGEQILNFLSSLNKEGKTILLVTHDSSLIKYTNRVINIKDGEISEKKWFLIFL